MTWLKQPVPGVIRGVAGFAGDVYGVEEVDCHIEGCRGFHVVKVMQGGVPRPPARGGIDAPGDYWLLLSTNGQDYSCECPGFLRHGRCRHLAGIRQLLTHRP